MSERPDLPARDRRQIIEVASVGVFAAAVALAGSLSVGVLVDDLDNAFLGRETPWSEIFFGNAFVLHLLLWKLGAVAVPEHPGLFVNVVVSFIHGAVAAGVTALLQQWCSRRWALAGGIGFALYRPSDEAWLWSAADSDVLVGAAILLAVALWLRDSQRTRWWALGAVVIALLAKATAVVLPAILAVASFLGREEGKPFDRLRRDAATLVCVTALSGAFAARFLLQGGRWTLAKYEAAQHSLFESAGEYGVALFRALALIDPRRFIPEGLAAAVAIAGVVAGILLAPSRVRSALLWTAAVLGPAVFVSGLAQPRYLYPASIPVLIGLAVGGQCLAERTAQAGRLAFAGFALWIAANAGLGVRDVVHLSRCGALNDRTRTLIAERIDGIRRADAFEVVNDPPIVRAEDFLHYDHRSAVKIRTPEQCTGENPCLIFERPVPVQSACPANPREFVKWRSDGRAEAGHE